MSLARSPITKPRPPEVTAAAIAVASIAVSIRGFPFKVEGADSGRFAPSPGAGREARGSAPARRSGHEVKRNAGHAGVRGGPLGRGTQLVQVVPDLEHAPGGQAQDGGEPAVRAVRAL